MSSESQPQKLKVGIVANEFFDEAVGRMGGFGWLAREAAFSLIENQTHEMDVVFLTGELRSKSGESETVSNGVPLIYAQDNWADYVHTLRLHNIDILLTIDYRPDYDYPIAALPDKPLIVWVQDPRPQEDIIKINSLRIPGQQSSQLKGINPIDCSPLKEVVKRSGENGRKVFFTSPAPQLIEKIEGTFGVTLLPSEMNFLPYPLRLKQIEINKTDHPRVIFLGRLDPIKRPWVFVELAKLFPGVEFCLLGKPHFKGEGAWKPANVPENVKFLGHLDGEEKSKMLSSAWILINTSIHEALPVSFLEALSFEIPIISCQNPENIVSRYGFYTGRFDYDGLDGLPQFERGLKNFLNDKSNRQKLGKEGRNWVQAHHNSEKFISIFRKLWGTAEVEEKTKLLKSNKEEGRRVLPEPWGVPEWSNNCYLAAREITELIPSNHTFILIDDDQLSNKFNKDFNVIPFIERDGLYFGAPENDDEAITELERLRHSDAGFIVFIWNAFWWLDYYTEFNRYLRKNFRCILQNERLIIFDLKKHA